MNPERISAGEAGASLAAIADQRARLAERLVTPRWYHPVLGLLLAMLMLCVGVDSPVVLGLGLAVYFVGLGLLVTVYRRRAGAWVNGFRPGRSRPAALATTVVLLGCGALSFAGRLQDWLWAPIVAAVVAFVAVVVLGRAFDRALGAELRGAPGEGRAAQPRRQARDRA